MFKSGLYVYCIFMCHLSLEKALKGLLVRRTGEYPPKSHSLIFFVEKLGIQMSDTSFEFIFTLNNLNRYDKFGIGIFFIHSKVNN